MTGFLQRLSAHSGLLLFILLIAVVVLGLLVLALFQRCYTLRHRLNSFTGGRPRPDVTLGEALAQYAKSVEGVTAETAQLLRRVSQLEDNMIYCTQKVGVVRYNPYEEAGGNLSFAVAILDGNDDGVVLNGIHSRTGTYVYAKPVQMGVSLYVLSQEELAALDKARASAYFPPEGSPQPDEGQISLFEGGGEQPGDNSVDK